MRNFVTTTALIALLSACSEEPPVPAPPATAAPATAAPTATAPGTTTPSEQAETGVTGAYFPNDPLPAGFAELEHLLLATIDENGAPAPLNGFLRPKKREAKDYVLLHPALEGTHLTFETATVNGVRYAFDGEFTQLAKFAENPPSSDTVVLTGTLRRMRDGEAAESTPVRFHYEAGG